MEGVLERKMWKRNDCDDDDGNNGRKKKGVYMEEFRWKKGRCCGGTRKVEEEKESRWTRSHYNIVPLHEFREYKFASSRENWLSSTLLLLRMSGGSWKGRICTAFRNQRGIVERPYVVG